MASAMMVRCEPGSPNRSALAGGAAASLNEQQALRPSASVFNDLSRCGGIAAVWPHSGQRGDAAAVIAYQHLGQRGSLPSSS